MEGHPSFLLGCCYLHRCQIVFFEQPKDGNELARIYAISYLERNKDKGNCSALNMAAYVSQGERSAFSTISYSKSPGDLAADRPSDIMHADV